MTDCVLNRPAFEYDVPAEDQKYVDASLEVRAELARMAAEVDAEGVYPLACMEAIERTALRDYALPIEEGGAAPERDFENLATMVQIRKNIAAGESSTAQIWTFSQGTSAVMLGRTSPLSAEARTEVLVQVRDHGARFCSPNAERHVGLGFNYQMAIRPTAGGVIVNGTKYFATGSAGARYGHSIGLLDGYKDVHSGGRYHVLVDFESDGVELHDDWDNMGQRATSSGSVTYTDVFVPDGFHWAGSTGSEVPDARGGLVLPFGLTAVILGIGMGAMDALCEHLKTRATWPGAVDDSSIRYQVGIHGARLMAAEAALMDAARYVKRYCMTGEGSHAEAALRNNAAKLAAVEAAVSLGADMQKFLGGQSSSNTYRYDRFWRNARTLSVQDVMDVKAQQIGAWLLKGDAPVVTTIS